MATVDGRPLWLVRISLADGETVERRVFGQYAGDAVAVALSGLVTTAESRAVFAGRLDDCRMSARQLSQ